MFEKNLKFFRLKKKMTKKELSEKCGVSQMSITHYENGTRRPDIEMIEKLAKALDVHVVDFLSSYNQNLVFQHGDFRKKSTLSKSEQEFVREAVEEYFNRFFDAVDALGGNPIAKAPACSCLNITNDFEKDALTLREHLGFGADGPIEDLIGRLEHKGILIMTVKIDNEKFSGMNGFVNDIPYIVINEGMNSMRKRTTAAHELAHLMFNWEEFKGDEEKYATAIAGAFLVPREDLIQRLGLERRRITKDLTLVCKEYAVSLYLLVTRAKQAGIISESLATDFYIRANKIGLSRTENDWAENEKSPELFKQLVYRAVNEEGLSIHKGAELLQVSVSEVDDNCGAYLEA